MFRIYVITKAGSWPLPPKYEDEREARNLCARLNANAEYIRHTGDIQYLPKLFIAYEVRAQAPEPPQPRPYSFQCALYAS